MTTTSRSIRVGPRWRSYTLDIPSGRTPRAGWPLIVALHGGGGSGEQFREQTRLRSDAHAIAWCDGVGSPRGWNNGLSINDASRADVDDVAYFDAVLDDAPRKTRINWRRIYATGFSQGAMMCWRLVAERSTVLAAVAPYAGDVPDLTVRPARRVPALYFHGIDDALLPVGGGVVKIGPFSFDAEHHSVAQTLAWSGAEYVPVTGCGHQWAGGMPIAVPGAGACPAVPDASGMVLAFFGRHSL